VSLGVVVGVIVYSQWHSYVDVVVGVTAGIATYMGHSRWCNHRHSHWHSYQYVEVS
jgi:glucose uptake protein GlcU